MKMPERMRARPSRSDGQAAYVLERTLDGLTPQQFGRGICCSAKCAGKAGFLACVARCQATGQACDGGIDNCESGC